MIGKGEWTMLKRVIFHVHEMKEWETILPTIQNALNDVADLQVLVLANGRAVRVAMREEYRQNLEKLVKQGVTIELCQHALTTQGFDPEMVNDQLFTLVPSGIAELINRQHDGYAYIRA
jgi:intracellular sulfur oxidation DsrE/DsrF family protein